MQYSSQLYITLIYLYLGKYLETCQSSIKDLRLIISYPIIISVDKTRFSCLPGLPV